MHHPPPTVLPSPKDIAGSDITKNFMPDISDYIWKSIERELPLSLNAMHAGVTTLMPPPFKHQGPT